MPGSRPLRTGLVDAGFAVADKLEGIGLGRLTGATRRLVARAGIDEHTVEVDGLAVGGSLADHGTYLHSLSGPVARSFHLELFREALSPGATVLDCGAHIGLHTLLAARAVGEDGTVIAVEPTPANVRALRANIARNGFVDRVEVVEAAATGTTGPAQLRIDPWLDRSRLVNSDDASVSTIEVAGVALDEVVGDRPLDVVKIDVEGAEALALGGLERALGRSRGVSVFLECHPARLLEFGTDPAAWLGGLRERGSLELFDEERRRLVPGDDDTVRAWVEAPPECFNARWSPRP